MKKIFAVALTALTVNANAALIEGSAEENYRNTGPNWSFTDTETFTPGSGSYTNGLFSLTYSGDFNTSSGEIFSVFLEGYDFGRLSDGNVGNDLFDNAFNGDRTYHNRTTTVTALVDDATLNDILADGSLTIGFQDHTAPGDWIDWIIAADWSLSYDEANVSEPGSLALLGLGILGLGAARKKAKKA